MRMRTEMFLFIMRLKVMYKHNPMQLSGTNRDKRVTLSASLHCYQDYLPRVYDQCLTPNLHDYSFLSNVIKEGGVIKYECA